MRKNHISADPFHKKGSKQNNGKHKNMLLRCAISIALILTVVLGAIYLYLYFSTKVYDGVYLPNIYINGINISGLTQQEAYNKLIDQVNKQQNSWSLNLNYGEHTYYTLDYNSLGIQTDTRQIYDYVKKAYTFGHTGNAFERNRDLQYLKENPFEAYTSQSEMSEQYLDSILDIIYKDMYKDPVNAYLVSFDPNAEDPFAIQKEQNGQQLDLARVKDEIFDYLTTGTSGTLMLIPDAIAPSVTESDVRKDVTLISTGITPISSSSSENRNNNIRVAFSRYNGLIIEPGKSVSFNDTVGERSFENGFYAAGEYVSGNLETGIGGGVCQASSTIYLAALLSNMTINKRTSHSDVVSYTTFGQDATVYWGYGRKIDFVFTNSSESNLYITAHVELLKNKTYQCVVRFYGKAMDEGTSYSLNTITVETIMAPLTTEYIKDTNHQYTTYTDEEYEVRKARDGFINETYLQKWHYDELISETLVSRDTCQARSSQVYVGTLQRPE